MRQSFKVNNWPKSIIIITITAIIAFISAYTILYGKYIKELGYKTEQLIEWNSSKSPNEANTPLSHSISHSFLEKVKAFKNKLIESSVEADKRDMTFIHYVDEFNYFNKKNLSGRNFSKKKILQKIS